MRRRAAADPQNQVRGAAVVDGPVAVHGDTGRRVGGVELGQEQRDVGRTRPVARGARGDQQVGGQRRADHHDLRRRSAPSRSPSRTAVVDTSPSCRPMSARWRPPRRRPCPRRSAPAAPRPPRRRARCSRPPATTTVSTYGSITSARPSSSAMTISSTGPPPIPPTDSGSVAPRMPELLGEAAPDVGLPARARPWPRSGSSPGRSGWTGTCRARRAAVPVPC